MSVLTSHASSAQSSQTSCLGNAMADFPGGWSSFPAFRLHLPAERSLWGTFAEVYVPEYLLFTSAFVYINPHVSEK
ncbi:hypothetical protein ColTof4_09728 [Colletotrichum tofieldiae]|nr:hypothetical protein ColTof3_05083 [Colletotrichum tofieldiae]GKT77305.1 hypothetical protein ColTof4_09728 [Colletotrichum tofieldiae]